MVFLGLNYVAVLAAALAGFLFGAVYYGVFGKAWMKAAALDPEDMKNNSTTLQKRLPFIFAGLSNLLMAFILAGLIGHFAIDVRHGLITAAFVWAGFVMPTALVNYSFQMRPLKLTLIDCGHWLGVLLFMGAIIGAMGAP